MKAILRSQYRIIKFIGKGGFGKTYLAEDLLLPSGNNSCVVKQLYPAIDNEHFLATARRLFTKEAETLQKVGKHDQIPRLLAYFEEDNQFYLVQQYIEGHTLTQELTSGKIWTEIQVIELLKDCLNILDFIHSQGVIHRDVKPDNLIRRHLDGKLVLVDFGTVKEVIIAQTQMIPSTVAIGTRGYMPTEQARGKPRFTSDIYALGAIAVQALTGIHPIDFPENDEGEIIWQSQTSIKSELAAIISQMVKYHFKDRYQSAKEILTILERIAPEAFLNTSSTSNKSKMYTPTRQVNSAQFSQLAATSQSKTEAANSSWQKTTQNSKNQLDSQQNIQNNTLPPNNLSSIKLPSREISQVEPKSQLTNPPQVNSSVQPNTYTYPQKASWFKSPAVIAAGSAIILGAAAMGGMYFLNQQNAQKLSNNQAESIKNLTSLYQEQKYSQCYEIIAAPDNNTLNSLPSEEKLNWQAQCGLGMARQEAETLNFPQALAIASSLPPVKNTEIASQIKTSIEEWSNETLQTATSLYEKEGKLKEALEYIQVIPQNTTAKAEATKLLAIWKQENSTNQKILAQSQKYLAEKRWQNALNEANKLTNSPIDYWQQQGRDIVSQAQAEIDAINSQQPKVTNSNKETPQDLSTKPSNNPQKSSVSSATEKNLRDLGDNPLDSSQKSSVPNSTQDNLRDLGNNPSNNDPINPVPSSNQETFRDL